MSGKSADPVPKFAKATFSSDYVFWIGSELLDRAVVILVCLPLAGSVLKAAWLEVRTFSSAW